MKKGVVDSFFPLTSYETKPIDLLSVICRMILACIAVYSSYSVYMEPTLIDDGYDHFKEAFFDMFTYVEDKIIQHHVNKIIFFNFSLSFRMERKFK